jgi:hypothetical protein
MSVSGSNGGAMPSGAGSEGNGNASGAMSEDGAQASQKPEAPKSYDDWFTAQDESTKTLLQGRFSTLEKTLDSERTQRKSFEKELRKLTRDMEASNPLKPELDKLTAAATDANQRAEFFEEAAKRHVSNPRYAWHVAKLEGLISESGRVDWSELKERVPEVFQAPKPRMPRVNAGEGAGPGAQYNAPGGMNMMIRRAAGKL